MDMTFNILIIWTWLYMTYHWDHVGLRRRGGWSYLHPQPPSITILPYLRLNTLYPRHSKINHVYAYRPSGLLVTPFHRNLKLWVRIPPHLFSTLPVSAFSWFIHLKQTNFYFYHPQSSTIPLQFPVTNLCGSPLFLWGGSRRIILSPRGWLRCNVGEHGTVHTLPPHFKPIK